MVILSIRSFILHLPNADVAEPDLVAVVLQGDVAGRVLAEAFPSGKFAAGHQLVPIGAGGWVFHNFFAVQVVYRSAFAHNQPDVVPFASRFGRRSVGRWQHIVERTSRPITVVTLFGIGVAVVVQDLYFGASQIGCAEFGVFMHMVHNAAIAAFGYFPVEFKFEVAVFFFGYQIAPVFAYQVHRVVVYCPGCGYGLAGFVVGVPARKGFSVEQDFPFAVVGWSGRKRGQEANEC